MTAKIERWILNPPQWEAVRHGSGPLLILAGAGSGKTRVITYRIGQLIANGAAAPWNILAVTFTNKAADEMRNRVARLSVETTGGVAIGTFHRTCAEMLRQNSEIAGLDRNFPIYDSADQLAAIRTAMKNLGLTPTQVSPAAARAEISRAKDELRTHFQYAEYAEGHIQEMVARVYRRYTEILAESGGLDFGDLIMRAVGLLRESPEVLSYYHDKYRYVMVDEYQDTNRAQYLLVRELCKAHRNLCVVGDDDQSIYGWRGADIRNLLDFEDEYPDAKVVKLEQNYRSTEMILNAAHGVVSKLPERKEKKLWTERVGGDSIRVIEAYDEEDEAHRILSELQASAVEERLGRGDVAVMYRTNAQSRPFEEAFVRAGIPYQLVGATEFYQRREVKDLLAYIRCLANPRDSVSFERIANVPARGIGPKTLDDLAQWAAGRSMTAGEAIRILPDGGADEISPRAAKALVPLGRLLANLDEMAGSTSLPALLQHVYRESGYEALLKLDEEAGEERIDNVVELVAASARYADLPPTDAMTAFLQDVSLVSDVDRMRADGDAVTLITLHAAKGLEFRQVFITGFEEELCPHMRSFADPVQMEEERRLAYVGITRAADSLVFTYCRYRGGWGSTSRLPSRFLHDIPKDLLDWERKPEQESQRIGWSANVSVGPDMKPSKTVLATERRFADGARVRHSVFGDGIVVTGKVGPGGEEVTVAFRSEGVKLLSAAFANLERI